MLQKYVSHLYKLTAAVHIYILDVLMRSLPYEISDFLDS
jgi:hypothetical protein